MNTHTRNYATVNSVAMESPAVRKYAATLTGGSLIAKYGLDYSGFWEVKTEGDETGRGQRIGFYNGALRDVIETVSLERDFYTYGGGGEITEVVPKIVTAESARVKVELRDKIRCAEEALAELRKKEGML